MQIQSYNNLSFKGVQFHPDYGEVQYTIATKMNAEGFDKTMEIIGKLINKKANTDIYLAGDLENPKIYAEIGGKTFKENFFNSPLRVVKKALKLADKFDKQA